MQIVRDLAGYTMGRSDLVRRAMSKKKAAVMEKERQNFIYGNEEENVPGCVSRGIPEDVAKLIYDEMTDFAKYAFNKSHAACYAVVSYQTAYLRCYYPKEFFAALLTSVLGSVGKVSEYIYTCRKMGIKLLPPDINKGYGEFSVDGDAIRYGMSAIKSLGRPVIDCIIEEREKNGDFKDLDDLIERLSGREINKRTLESFIKAGALDSFGVKRRQLMIVYSDVMDRINSDKRTNIAGQMSLFDMVDNAPSATHYPNVAEYTKEEMLGYEKEVLGVYVSGHPMDDYEDVWRKNITNYTTDFLSTEDTPAKVADGKKVTVGGMITAKTLKSTKTGNQMAFINVEDIMGMVEVIVFPKVFEQCRTKLTEDNKVFVIGRAAIDEEEAGKIICDRIISFDEVPKDVWIQFENKEAYFSSEEKLMETIRSSDGGDGVVIYLKAEKQKKVLPKNQSIFANAETLSKLYALYGQENVKVVQKTIEKW